MFLSLFSFCETLPSLMYQGYKKWVATAHPATSGVAVFQIIDEHKFSPSLTIFVFAETLFPTRTLPWGGGGGVKWGFFSGLYFFFIFLAAISSYHLNGGSFHHIRPSHCFANNFQTRV